MSQGKPLIELPIGKKFGRLTLLGRSNRRDPKTLWVSMRCDCSTVKDVNWGNVRNGSTKSCGCQKNPIKDRTGQRFGSLVAIHRIDVGKKPVYWHCQCDCGKTKAVLSACLGGGDTQSCGCKVHQHLRAISKKGASTLKLPYGESSRRIVLQRYKNQAKSRGYSWELTDEQATWMFHQPCEYCGSSPSSVQLHGGSHGEYVYSGIDRKVNEIGYTATNCVPCCKVCNRAKNAMPEAEFREWIARLTNHQNSKQQSKAA